MKIITHVEDIGIVGAYDLSDTQLVDISYTIDWLKQESPNFPSGHFDATIELLENIVKDGECEHTDN